MSPIVHRTLSTVAALAIVAAALTGCSGDPDYLSRDEMLDPETCKGCHPKHYEEWSGSMHAYAADDPVFLAMNRRGQEETGGDLGSFCVGCHAPMAVADGLTTDGLNLDTVPQKYKGVTCFFCHTAESVTDDHNNPIVLADNEIMRGGIDNAIDNGVHATAYSPLHDRASQESSNLCGSCHDIVTPAGVHLERTFKEWKESIFASPEPTKHLSCSACHMKGDVDGVIADFPGVPLRRPREHTFPGIDVAITPWPQKQQQLDGIARDLFGSLLPKLCVFSDAGGFRADYTLDNVFGGHMIPSGAAQDRRMWVEIRAYRGGAEVYSSGVVAAGTPVSTLADPDLWQIRDFGTDDQGQETHMFWDVRNVRSELLPPAVTNDMTDPRFNHSVTRGFLITGAAPDRVTAVVHIRPIGLDVIDDLIGTGHLESSLRDEIVTLTLTGTQLEWTATSQGVGFCAEP